MQLQVNVIDLGTERVMPSYQSWNYLKLRQLPMYICMKDMEEKSMLHATVNSKSV